MLFNIQEVITMIIIIIPMDGHSLNDTNNLCMYKLWSYYVRYKYRTVLSSYSIIIIIYNRYVWIKRKIGFT